MAIIGLEDYPTFNLKHKNLNLREKETYNEIV